METTFPRELITEDIRKIEAYINATWPRFATQKEVRLSKLFPEPDNTGLRHIWKFGSADLVVYRDGKPVSIIESGGTHHFEEKQSLNDRRKWKLAEINGVRCLTMMNGLMEGLSKRKWRLLLGRYLFGCANQTES
jgi:hypothetical protein